MNTIRRLVKARRINANINTGVAKYFPLIKFADYVAVAHRKINVKNLKKYKNYKIISGDINTNKVSKAFRLYKSKFKRKQKII